MELLHTVFELGDLILVHATTTTQSLFHLSLSLFFLSFFFPFNLLTFLVNWYMETVSQATLMKIFVGIFGMQHSQFFLQYEDNQSSFLILRFELLLE